MQVLTSTPDPGRDAYMRMFQRMKTASPASYYILTIVEPATDALLAIGSVFLEHKFIRNLGICGHIEDIAVDAKAQGKGLGKRLILALTQLSEALGSYKVILDCSEENQGMCVHVAIRPHSDANKSPSLALHRILRKVRVRDP